MQSGTVATRPHWSQHTSIAATRHHDSICVNVRASNYPAFWVCVCVCVLNANAKSMDVYDMCCMLHVDGRLERDQHQRIVLTFGRKYTVCIWKWTSYRTTLAPRIYYRRFTAFCECEDEADKRWLWGWNRSARAQHYCGACTNGRCWRCTVWLWRQNEFILTSQCETTSQCEKFHIRVRVEIAADVHSLLLQRECAAQCTFAGWMLWNAFHFRITHNKQQHPNQCPIRTHSMQCTRFYRAIALRRLALLPAKMHHALCDLASTWVLCAWCCANECMIRRSQSHHRTKFVCSVQFEAFSCDWVSNVNFTWKRGTRDTASTNARKRGAGVASERMRRLSGGCLVGICIMRVYEHANVLMGLRCSHHHSI